MAQLNIYSFDECSLVIGRIAIGIFTKFWYKMNSKQRQKIFANYILLEDTV